MPAAKGGEFPGLRWRLRSASGGDYDRPQVAKTPARAIGNKDRLLRSGAELVFRLCAVMGAEVVIVDAPGQSSFEADLARDVLEIITVFSAKLYGARSTKRRRGDAV